MAYAVDFMSLREPCAPISGSSVRHSVGIAQNTVGLLSNRASATMGYGR